YLLGTVNIPEVSYGDNSKLLSEWLKQLNFWKPIELMELGMGKIVAWIGDQLTVDRLRRLFVFRADDDNFFDRMDCSIFIFGWLHAQMAFANSLHKQYLGTSKGRGLHQAFEALNRKGLYKTRTQGPFYHDLVEALYHVAEAHIRVDWCRIGCVTSLKDLRSLSAHSLYDLAKKMIVNTHASSEALDMMDHKPELVDEQERQVVMFNRDVLQFIVLDRAIRHGDVTIMEDMLLTLLCRFMGGNKGKYANEVLELLQGLNREWPDEI
ncbi:hypothetical protein CVT24_010233, partial [Panaeolus cyanescens]